MNHYEKLLGILFGAVLGLAIMIGSARGEIDELQDKVDRLEAKALWSYSRIIELEKDK